MRNLPNSYGALRKPPRPLYLGICAGTSRLLRTRTTTLLWHRLAENPTHGFDASSEELEALDPHHVWTHEYAESRLKWRPKKPLTVLVLRTCLLPELVELACRPEYGGCKSFIDLLQEIPTASARPVLDDAAFEKLTRPAFALLEGLRPAPVGS